MGSHVEGTAVTTVGSHVEGTVGSHVEGTVGSHLGSPVGSHAESPVGSHGAAEVDDPNHPLGLADRLDDVLLKIEDWAVRHRSFAFAAVVAIGIGAGGWWMLDSRSPDRPIEDTIPMAASDQRPGSTPAVPTTAGRSTPDQPPGADDQFGEEVAEEPPAPVVVVHVVGAVEHPGLVTLDPMARVGDAVAAAGGPIEGAALDRLNLAAPVVDGMQVRVPTSDEPAGQPPDEPLIQLPPPVTGSPTDSTASAQPVDLNVATAELLDTLPGIGPATAAAIVSWREEHGPFVVVDDLQGVPGIGPVKLANLRELVTV